MRTRVILFIALVFAGFAEQKLAAQSKGRVVMLETLGAQGGIVMYNTYCLIGAMHDGFVRDAWDDTQVSAILEEQSGLMVSMAVQYDSLLATGYLDEEDSLFVSDMRSCCYLLKKEADCLNDYVNDQTTENHDRYLNARSAAWTLIAELLGIDAQSYWGGAPGLPQGTK